MLMFICMQLLAILEDDIEDMSVMSLCAPLCFANAF